MIEVFDFIECDTFLISQVLHEELGDYYHAPHTGRIRVENNLSDILFP